MTLSDALKTTPLAHDKNLGDDVREIYAGAPDAALDLIAGMAGSSGYLRGLLEREQAWFAGVLGQDPTAVFEAVLTDVDGGDLARSLRQAKRRVALLLAACDLGGVWALEEVTERLTRFADFATDMAFRSEVQRYFERGKLTGVSASDLEDCVGIAVLAMGKMGAGELNYSSDIDLIVLFDDTRYSAENYDENRMAFQRITRDAAKILSDVTGDGYVFRTDLRLRPNPSVTPVCVPMDAAERYYESEGRTWERAAFIKARACAGDIAGGQRFLQRIKPFVWRKHLDFVAIQDAHDMRLAIRSHKGLGGPISVPGHDMKLGRGGIREIEFFAQTQQLISGGRDADLRSSKTVQALRDLAAKGWVPEGVCRVLIEAYRAHRGIEHRIQMLRDAQTHKVPKGGEALDQLARLSGWADTEAFLADQKQRLEQVHQLIEGFFAPKEADVEQSVELAPDLVEVIDSWVGLPALRAPRAVEIFERLRPALEGRVAQAERPEFALTQLDGFIRRLPAGVQLFSLFEANPQILDLLLDVCSVAPALATYLSRHTGVLDAVISGAFFEPLPKIDGFCAGLQTVLAECSDFEQALNETRRWQKEQHFRIGVLLLRQLADLEEVEQGYSDLAQAVLQGLLPFVSDEVARRYGRFDAQSVAVLAMGKLGSRQMTATSDLDLILIYQCDGEVSDGKRGLAPTQYFARLTQTLITALATPMADGALYEVDMRLRPSGRQGPVATAIAAFENYQRDEAWTWEHLALTRARVVAGDTDLGARLDAVRRDVLANHRADDVVRQDVIDMRARLAQAKGAVAGVWEVKDLSGGILDIELIAQTQALLAGNEAVDPRVQLSVGGMLDHSLADTHRLLCSVQQAQRLVVDGVFDPAALGREGMVFLVGFAGFEDEDSLKEAILAQTAAAEAEILRFLAVK